MNSNLEKVAIVANIFGIGASISVIVNPPNIAFLILGLALLALNSSLLYSNLSRK